MLVMGCVPVLGQFVRDRRAVLGITQEELGVRVRRPQKWISRLENELKELPDPDVMAALALALEVPESDLLQAAGYLTAEGGGADLVIDDEARIYASMVEGLHHMDLDPEDRAAIKRMIDYARAESQRRKPKDS